MSRLRIFRGRLFPLFSPVGAGGVHTEWTQNLLPIEDRQVLTSQRVELQIMGTGNLFLSRQRQLQTPVVSTNASFKLKLKDLACGLQLKLKAGACGLRLERGLLIFPPQGLFVHVSQGRHPIIPLFQHSIIFFVDK